MPYPATLERLTDPTPSPDYVPRTNPAAGPREFVRADHMGTTPADVIRAIRRLSTMPVRTDLAAMLAALGSVVASVDDKASAYLDAAHDLLDVRDKSEPRAAQAHRATLATVAKHVGSQL